MSDPDIAGYRYVQSSLNQSHRYLLPAVSRVLDELSVPARERRLFELGCGNGSVAYELTRCGWDVTGVDPTSEGIEQGRAAHPELKRARGSAYDDIATQYGQFPVMCMRRAGSTAGYNSGQSRTGLGACYTARSWGGENRQLF